MTKHFAWTDKVETDLAILWADPHTTAESIAVTMGLTLHQVKNRARKIGFEKGAKMRDYPIVSVEDGCLGVLVPGNGRDDHIVWIDGDKYGWFSAFFWFVHHERGMFYVIRGDQKKLHRVLINAGPTDLVDHRDRNGLNNRMRNLRIATCAQNIHNSGPRVHARSSYKGVWLHECGKYSSALRCPDGRRRRIGYYETEYEAARAHDAVARHFRGEFAFLNVPDDLMSDAEIEAVPALRRLINRRSFMEAAD